MPVKKRAMPTTTLRQARVSTRSKHSKRYTNSGIYFPGFHRSGATIGRDKKKIFRTGIIPEMTNLLEHTGTTASNFFSKGC
jgi:hypothetical protein